MERPTPDGLRIALVCPYSFSVPGGVQRHVGGLAAYLRGLGAAVDVLAPVDDPQAAVGVIGVGRSLGIHDNGSVTRLALSPAAAARTRVLLARGRYDVVHLHEPMLPAACLAALLAPAAPAVATFHMTAESRRWYRLFRPVVRHAARRLAARVAVSDAARRYAQPAVGGDFTVIPNGLDTAPFRRRAAVGGGGILFVGRPEPRKGLRVLLEAWARLPAPRPPLHLAGVTPRALEGALAGAGTPRGGLHAHGRVSDDALCDLLAAADVVCAPSLWGESFGLVLVEAMAAGVPVVASDLPGYADVVGPHAGLLTPPGDAAAVARGLRAVLSDDARRRRMAVAARRRARAFDWDRIGPRVLAVYARAMAGSA